MGVIEIMGRQLGVIEGWLGVMGGSLGSWRGGWGSWRGGGGAVRGHEGWLGAWGKEQQGVQGCSEHLGGRTRLWGRVRYGAGRVVGQGEVTGQARLWVSPPHSRTDLRPIALQQQEVWPALGGLHEARRRLLIIVLLIRGGPLGAPIAAGSGGVRGGPGVAPHHTEHRSALPAAPRTEVEVAEAAAQGEVLRAVLGGGRRSGGGAGAGTALLGGGDCGDRQREGGGHGEGPGMCGRGDVGRQGGHGGGG